MNISNELKKIEALKRLETISNAFDLGPKLVKYLNEDKLYYSYAYSMDTINYDKRYAEAVKCFETRYDAYVYHVIEANTNIGTMLSFLFVGDNEEDWTMQQLEGKYIYSYSFVIENENSWVEGEFGDIVLDSPLGYLMRIG